MSNKTAIYTVITNNYDVPKPIKPEPNYDYIMFTDDDSLKVDGWEMRYTKEPQRKIKLLPHIFLPDYEATLYMDGNISPRNGLTRFITSYASSFITMKHPIRNCFIKEHYECIRLNKAGDNLIREQLAYNITLGLQPEQGMYQTGVIYRRNEKEVNEFCDIWYEELSKFTHRDQLSIMTAVFKTGFKPKQIDYRYFNQHFDIKPHKLKKKPNIFYFTPYNTDGNIGKAMNAHCEIAPENSWIAVMDGDILFPNPQWGVIVERAIMDYGNEYQLIGCVTNRVGGEHQRVDGMFSDTDMVNHYKKAIEIESSEVVDTSGVAGYFMLFKKETWLKAKGFTEDIKLSHQFDTVFNKSVRNIGGKIGLIKGLYALHMYRIWEGDNVQNSRASTAHLFRNHK